MKKHKEALDSLIDAFHAVADAPEPEGIRSLRSQVTKLSTLLEHDSEKIVCRQANVRLSSALKFKTHKKRKELLDQAKDKLLRLR